MYCVFVCVCVMWCVFMCGVCLCVCMCVCVCVCVCVCTFLNSTSFTCRSCSWDADFFLFVLRVPRGMVAVVSTPT